MDNALFAFDDPAAARSAVERLTACGVDPRAVQLHFNDAAVGHSFGRAADEQVTGGLLTNLSGLFQGIFEWGKSPHDASAFVETVNRGGAVVSVDAASAGDQAKVDRAVAEVGCDARTDWRARADF